jgi:Na+/alanine symporter
VFVNVGCRRGDCNEQDGATVNGGKCFTPAKQGLVQSFSVYIDTLLVCSATGFMLLITGKYNVQNPGFGTEGASRFLYEGAKMLP